MNARQYRNYLRLMQLPVKERVRIARSATGDTQVVLAYDPQMEVIKALLDNPALGVGCLINIVKKRNLPSTILEQIYENKTWLSQYDIKFELLKNPKTPLHLSLKLLRYMFRRELQELARNVSVSQVIRQSATSLLESKLSDMQVGEKIALAKEAVGPILTLLIHEPHPLIVRAALQNPRLRENDVVILANNRSITPSIVEEIFNSSWRTRYHVKIALANNPNTPLELARQLLRDLMQQDLIQVIGNQQLPLETRLLSRYVLKKKINSLSQRELERLTLSTRREVITILLEKDDVTIVRLLEKNPRVREGQIVSLAVTTSCTEVLMFLATQSRWRFKKKVRQALRSNPLARQIALNE